jgi:nitrite reductase (NO-forming)
VQTVTVPPGGAAAVDITLQVPGRVSLVDHALSRIGASQSVCFRFEGPDNPDVFRKLPDQTAAIN